MALHFSRRLTTIFRQTIAAQPLLSSFATLGGLSAIFAFYQLSSFVATHFLHRSRLRNYLSDDGAAWALITGSSGGLGRAFAEELLSHGFNVILHGRNAAKLERIKTELLLQWPQRNIDFIVLDAMLDVDDPRKMECAIQRLRDHKIKILINNVAGELDPLLLAHTESSSDRNRKIINGNFMFATELTRLLLPQLIDNKPSLIMNIGSGSAKLPCPYFAMGAASKTFLQSFSHALSVELKAEGHPQVEVLYNLVGMCSTTSEPRPVTFWVPSSRRFANTSLSLVGRDRGSVWGYWPHALQFEPLLMLPRTIVERLCIALVKGMKLEYDNRAKA
ncbi:hypothetical protein CKM354_000954300 [Cercospora kikuchii]|uniref:Very-long-chain 3-oxoacyl-CoA reductase n=1 Tax=Cercospora kikuchii TaxID=84275 RepID=A0A9P3CRV4_9PEZI|nr:uncharacterized protein CKM354_000954300 [Cercospora kikuchii]GIZ46417.1 hypothetical protein CKM354_000954300 [Cercospora kikuchii]